MAWDNSNLVFLKVFGVFLIHLVSAEVLGRLDVPKCSYIFSSWCPDWELSQGPQFLSTWSPPWTAWASSQHGSEHCSEDLKKIVPSGKGGSYRSFNNKPLKLHSIISAPILLFKAGHWSIANLRGEKIDLCLDRRVARSYHKEVDGMADIIIIIFVKTIYHYLSSGHKNSYSCHMKNILTLSPQNLIPF